MRGARGANEGVTKKNVVPAKGTTAAEANKSLRAVRYGTGRSEIARVGTANSAIGLGRTGKDALWNKGVCSGRKAAAAPVPRKRRGSA